MRLSSILLVLPVALAWFDNGHMLVSEIARQEIGDELADKFNAVIKSMSEYAAGWDVTTVAVWLDHMKCSKEASYCPVKYLAALDEFNSWHFADKPYNPDHITNEIIREVEKNYASEPSAPWLLERATTTFNSGDDPFAWSLMLRMVIHILGDIHQPLHATEGFFNDSKWGDLSRGDRGGNEIFLEGPFANLHALWDAAGGLYPLTMPVPLPGDLAAALRTNASQLRTNFPRSSFPQLKPVRTYNRYVFESWVNETYDLSPTNVYSEDIAPRTTPSEKYLANVIKTCQPQIALGGYRLADFLRSISARLPAPLPSPPAIRDEKADLMTALAVGFGILSGALLIVVAAFTYALVRTWRTGPLGGYSTYTQQSV